MADGIYLDPANVENMVSF